VKFSSGKGLARLLAATGACLALAGFPARASVHSLTLADGSTLNVWEQQSRSAFNRGISSWSIRYSVVDAAGTHPGIVSPTGDASRDSAPALTLDSTGTPVLVWSRFDGSYDKVAYARFSQGVWVDFHYLTFGPGDDDQPRVGTGQTGSFLFFITSPGRYQYAPVDLDTGHLIAPPRALGLGAARRDIEEIKTPNLRMTRDGGSDIPINNRCMGSKQCGGGVPSGSSILDPGQGTVQGGLDIPIANAKASVWGVGSSGDCRNMVLTLPGRDGKTVYVFRFARGPMTALQRLDLPPQVGDRFGADLSASYLPTNCN
jgi:hypothetical protein